MRAFLFHRWTSLVIRVALGIIFIVAAIPKIQDPPTFAHMIYNYRLVPAGAINLMAMVLPWLEFACGVSLIIGFWKRTSAMIVALLLVVFIAALGINVARDHAVNCGCFQLTEATKSHADLIADMKWNILRDIGMLLLCAQVLASPRGQRADRRL